MTYKRSFGGPREKINLETNLDGALWKSNNVSFRIWIIKKSLDCWIEGNGKFLWVLE
jgi:hypothetical protein